MPRDSSGRSRHKLILPSVAMVLGMVAFLVGLIMLLLKIGGESLLNVHISQLDVTTTSDAIAVMLIGAGMTVGVFFIAAWVDVQWAKYGAREDVYSTIALRGAGAPDEVRK